MSILLKILSMHFVALITPGPDFFLTLKTTLERGKTAGIYTAGGFAAGMLIHSGYCTLGLSQFIIGGSGLFYLKIASAVIFLIIGIQVLVSSVKSFASVQSDDFHERISGKKEKVFSRKEKFFFFQRGFLTNLFNPKAVIFTIGLFAASIDKDTDVKILLLASFAIFLITFFWFFIVAHFFAISKFRKIYFQLQKPLNIIFACYFILISIGIFLHEISA